MGSLIRRWSQSQDQNGAGKSLLFEAIALLWRAISVWERQSIVPDRLIGPWGDTCDIEVTVVLTDDEQDELADFSSRVGVPEPAALRAAMGLNLTREDKPVELRVEEWASPLWTLEFTRTHAFGTWTTFRPIGHSREASTPPSIRRC